MPRNWRTWPDQVIQDYIAANEDTDDDSVISLIDDMEDELDKRGQEDHLVDHWDAREGERPSWDY